MSGSEIARLRQRLEEEYTAGRRALYGLASGWAKHEYIHRRLRNMEQYHKELAEIVGTDRATEIVCEVLDTVREEEAPRGRADGRGSSRDRGSGERAGGPGGSAGKEQPRDQSEEEDSDEIIEKTLWLLAYRHREEEADILYFFYAVSEEEAQIVAGLKLDEGEEKLSLLTLRALPHGFGVPYGRYRGVIHVRVDGSIVEGDYLIERKPTQD
jgi:hypothetical protein